MTYTTVYAVGKLELPNLGVTEHDARAILINDLFSPRMVETNVQTNIIHINS